MFMAMSTNDTPPSPVNEAIWRIDMRCHWVAASGSHGKPLSSQVRVHSMITHNPARPKSASNRVIIGFPSMRGMTHQAAKYHEPIHSPMNGPSRISPPQVTLCSQLRMIVHAMAWAAKIVHAKRRNEGLR